MIPKTSIETTNRSGRMAVPLGCILTLPPICWVGTARWAVRAAQSGATGALRVVRAHAFRSVRSTRTVTPQRGIPTFWGQCQDAAVPLDVRCFPLLLLLAVLACTGCHTTKTLPPADLSDPAWRVRQGQAVWKPRKDKTELAGELLLATRSSGDMFVQFQKTPFTVVTAQTAGEDWFIEFGSGARRWSGRGEPSQRLVWFHLPRLLEGEAVRGWNVSNLTENSWRVENPRTGESLEGGFLP